MKETDRTIAVLPNERALITQALPPERLAAIKVGILGAEEIGEGERRSMETALRMTNDQ